MDSKWPKITFYISLQLEKIFKTVNHPNQDKPDRKIKKDRTDLRKIIFTTLLNTVIIIL